MADRDDWRFGDEGEPAVCPRCGKDNRPGLGRCVICGTTLVVEDEGDEPPLRTIGAAMGGRPRGRRRRRGWLWPAAVLAFLGVVGVMLWTLAPHERTPDIGLPETSRTLGPPPIAPAATRAPQPTATPRPTIVAPAVVPPPPPAPAAVPPIATRAPAATPVRTPRPAAPTSLFVTAPPVRTPQPRPTAPPAPEPPPVPDVDVAPPPAEAPPAGTAPSIEKPSLGTDLQDATRAYRAAIEAHNARVDEYNALADALQRRDPADDGPETQALERRLARARLEAERAAAVADQRRQDLDAVRARYR